MVSLPTDLFTRMNYLYMSMHVSQVHVCYREHEDTAYRECTRETGIRDTTAEGGKATTTKSAAPKEVVLNIVSKRYITQLTHLRLSHSARIHLELCHSV